MSPVLLGTLEQRKRQIIATGTFHTKKSQCVLGPPGFCRQYIPTWENIVVSSPYQVIQKATSFEWDPEGEKKGSATGSGCNAAVTSDPILSENWQLEKCCAEFITNYTRRITT